MIIEILLIRKKLRPLNGGEKMLSHPQLKFVKFGTDVMILKIFSHWRSAR
jgi:hypothetical protein